ncbi:uncharacterized protein LOC133790780 isoform X2 [Humulus lupulus]|uniref:uncharacterized protein LOC133790780 isoform X2 n=1 Tax=Humulus lupulus TaxID=3486 RepID=UPI002B40BCD5|nr:uncharacterized protein LOC133790780 isoform X2 [Humulus lupulus]XP_062084542.1 uncharacterized protein LOC133790780 isoform X2 [Humulus lupulus]XP_062084552.1 uncharacterized protein LOC133790780 isoform X2 [Humulus lupulus]
MEEKEERARILLGLSPNCEPTHSQLKAAYRRKVWESHPDLFPPHLKPLAESNFKSISEAYSFLLSPSPSPGGRGRGKYDRGAPFPRGAQGRNHALLVQVPFLFIVLGTLALGGFIGSRAYTKQKHSYPSHNPFLP